MSFDIFGSAQKDSIRVGYISTDRGYVEDITICEANRYAEKNPGTRFIFKTRNFVKYLNINGVNDLTPEDLVSGEDTCTGIVIEKECGPAKVYFYGGGGVGAQANAIIGLDGALLAVDMVSQGFGYQYPPIVEVKDSCGIGAGAVVRAVLGEVIETVEYYDEEEDTEFYDFELCPPDEAGYGLRYDPEGNVIGEWDPTLYANTSKDPIRREIQEYQDFLQKFQKPWWTTRKENPLRVTSSRGTSRVKFDVTHPAWSEFLNKYAISPVPPSNAKGSDFAGEEFTFEWEEEFPYDGEYVFRAQADNIGRFYLDNQKILETTEFKQDQTPKLIKQTVKAGVHRIRIDLFNIPIQEKVVKQQPVQQPVEQQDTVLVDEPINDLKPPGIYLDLTSLPNQPIGVSFRQVSPLGSGIRINIPEIGTISSTNSGNYNSAESYSNLDGLPRNPVNAEVTLQGGRIYGPCTIVQDNNFRQTDLYIGLNLPGEFRIEGGPTANPERTYSYYQRVISLQAEDWGFRPDVNAIGGFVITKAPPNIEKTYTLNDATLEPELFAMLNERSFNDGRIYLGESVDFVYFQASQGFFKRYSQPFSSTPVKVRTSAIKPKPEPPKIPPAKSTSSSGTQARKIFNTVDYINKSNRTLWRINPSAGRDSDFYNQYGVLPFDPTSERSQNESFAGTHQIIWDNLDFPVDGNYNIEIMVDDNVTLIFIGPNSETIITKRGFSSPGRSTGKSFETRAFVSGKYRLIADLEQIEVGPLSPINPMALAVNVEVTFTEDEVISPKSWNDNPMGATLTIDAPNPPIPQEPIPLQEGRCPRNPIWTTRFPGAKEKWWPVNVEPWSKFTNRYALSPLPPLSTPGSDGAGVVYQNSWDLDAPYDGFYALKGTVDNVGKVLVDGKVILDEKPENLEIGLLEHFKVENPKAKKFFLSKGMHTIQVEVLNLKIETFTTINKKIFSTSDWLVPLPPQQPTIPDDLIDEPTNDLNPPGIYLDLTQYRADENVNCSFDVPLGSDLSLNIPEVGVVNGVNAGSGRAVVIGSSSAVKPIGGDYGGDLFLKGGRLYGPITIVPKQEYKQSDLFIGIAVGMVNDPNVELNQNTAFYGSNKSWIPYITYLQRVTGRDAQQEGSGFLNVYFQESLNAFAIIESSRPEDADNNNYTPIKFDAVLGFTIRTSGGFFKRYSQPFSSTPAKVRTSTIKPKPQLNPLSSSIIGTAKDGVTYEGPELVHYSDSRWSSYMNTYSVSPYLSDINTPNDNIVSTFILIWKNVNFPEDGQYETKMQGDNIVNLKIGVNNIRTVTDFFGEPIREFVNITKGNYDVIVEITNLPSSNIFLQNPMGVALDITKNVKVSSDVGPSWTTNPTGISAIMIPPPCPKRIKGRGVIPIVIVDDPGTKYPPPPPPDDSTITDPTPLVPPEPPPGPPGTPPPGTPPPVDRYPVCLILDEVIVEDSGINYNCGVDKLQIIPDNGVILDYTCDTFGRISQVKILDNGGCFPVYPQITMQTDTGINATFRPVFRVVRDPVDPALTRDKQKLIQVTDLVGLKLTGYVNGRPYYGAVFYENGVRFAGYYKTIGTPLLVYDTLQESIDAQVTTPPSAIQRQGTDIRSNNPRLNIPGTPGEII